MKTREDVSKIFNMILATMKTDLDINKNPDHTEMAVGFVDYLEKFGFDLAYEILYEYLYIYPTTFFDWSKIVGILRDKVKTEYLTTDLALTKLLKQMGGYNPIDSEPPMDIVTKQTVDALGGYYQVCKSENLSKEFPAVYSKILEKVVAERMKNG